MDFIFMREGETQSGITHQQRYLELVDEVLLAENIGRDAFGGHQQPTHAPVDTTH
jgi:hypothetical protein